jgi:hypothetical protein
MLSPQHLFFEILKKKMIFFMKTRSARVREQPANINNISLYFNILAK